MTTLTLSLDAAKSRALRAARQAAAASPLADARVVRAGRRAWKVLRPAWQRVLRAHRRYAQGNGDALAGALTYALLICGAPALVLTVIALNVVGVKPVVVGSQVSQSAGILLPPQFAGVVSHIPPVPLGFRVGLAGVLVWMALRLIRALRTGVRAMCGQHAGSGNPARDTVRDAVLGMLLLAATILIVYVTALTRTLSARMPGGAVAGVLIGVVSVWGLFICVMLLGPWDDKGRPGVPAALRASLVAACVVGLLTFGARGYFTATAGLHRELFQSAGAVIGVLLWCNLLCRILLRAVAWASTATAATTATETAGATTATEATTATGATTATETTTATEMTAATERGHREAVDGA